MELIHKQLRSPGPSILCVIVGSGMQISHFLDPITILIAKVSTQY